MATPNICTQISTRFAADFWPTLVAKQAQYHSTHGRYWQGLRTHSTIPANGFSASADRANRVARGHTGSWSTHFTMPLMRCSLACNEWQGPVGQGFDVEMLVRVNNDTWRCCVSLGADDRMVPRLDWHPMLPLPRPRGAG